MTAVGPIGRLGRFTVDHGRAVAVAWIVVAVALGVFAPTVEHALSGAGWQANGSESVQARKLIQTNFAGLSSSALMVVVHSGDQTVVLARLPADRRGASSARSGPTARVASVVPPRPGASISPMGTRQSSLPARTATRPQWSPRPTR